MSKDVGNVGGLFSYVSEVCPYVCGAGGVLCFRVLGGGFMLEYRE